MRCRSCQSEIGEGAQFCQFCGARQAGGGPGRRLMRSATDKKLGGVCAGLADYWDMDPTIVRIVWAFVTLLTGLVPGAIAYLVAWFLMPEAPYFSMPAGAAPRAGTPGAGPA